MRGCPAPTDLDIAITVTAMMNSSSEALPWPCPPDCAPPTPDGTPGSRQRITILGAREIGCGDVEFELLDTFEAPGWRPPGRLISQAKGDLCQFDAHGGGDVAQGVQQRFRCAGGSRCWTASRLVARHPRAGLSTLQFAAQQSLGPAGQQAITIPICSPSANGNVITSGARCASGVD